MKQKFILALLCLQLTATGQVPVLSSCPAAAPVIFLDFDGHTVTNTSWNYDGPIVCNASGLNNTQITEVFNRVAEDFRPFNVNITTDSARFIAAPVNKRTRVLITTSYEWYGVAGGVSFVGSFTWGDDSPCFVFSSLHGFNVKNIAEAAAHEAGHTLGLFHQALYGANCQLSSEYHPGDGFGETSWAPIMGIGYNRNLTTWYNGPTANGCNTIQDDRAIIASTANGITLKADDNANTTATATSLTVTNNIFSTTGHFEQVNDEDLFRLQVSSPSRLVFTARPSNVGLQNAGANSDILVQLFNNNMTLLKTRNPADSVQASIDSLLNTGTYYIRLKTVTNVYAPSTYGMSGQYTINGNLIPNSTLPLHRLELSGKKIGNQHELQWVIEADEKILSAAIEFSGNGSVFTPLTQFTKETGAYRYTPACDQGGIQYRLKAVFDNNQTYYSKTITLYCNGETSDPVVIGNPVTNRMIHVKGNSTFTCQVFDMQGRRLISRQLADGMTTIPVSTEKNGLYIIRFTRQDGYTTSTKIVIQ